MNTQPTFYDVRAIAPAWRLLPGGPVAEDRATGEVWQYMGSQYEDGGAIHTFRHRCHPQTGTRRYVRIRENDSGIGLLQERAV